MSIDEYTNHNDSKGLTVRRVAAASNADRARMLATLNERDMGCVTLYMSKHELKSLRRQAAFLALNPDGLLRNR